MARRSLERGKVPSGSQWMVLVMVVLAAVIAEAVAGWLAGLDPPLLFISALTGIIPGAVLGMAVIGWSLGNRHGPSTRRMNIPGRIAFVLVGLLLLAVFHLAFALRTYV